MDQIFAVRLDNGSTLIVKAAEELGLQAHDLCVFRRDFYTDLGEIRREVAPPENPGELPTAIRKAETADLATANENDAKARSAMQTAHRFVSSLGLEMKLLNAHYSLDGKLVTIQFSADGRVDFRLCTRIELRQIGVRDETGIHGGIAVCGQQLCCSRFLKEFNSINVKMAKEQDLSLTPATISGVCGRLKCCLKYEHEGYQELEKGMPRRGEWCDTPQGRGRISDRNLLTRKVSVTLESGNVVPSERRPGGGGNGGGSRRNRDGGRRNGSGQSPRRGGDAVPAPKEGAGGGSGAAE